MEFKEFKTAVQRRFNDLKEHTVFQANIDKDTLWGIYLSSFPEGTNPLFRERTEHDCSCCRQFIKNAGGMVAISEERELSVKHFSRNGVGIEVDRYAIEYRAVVDGVVLATYRFECYERMRGYLNRQNYPWRACSIVYQKALEFLRNNACSPGDCT